jgi:hypothetical protein
MGLGLVRSDLPITDHPITRDAFSPVRLSHHFRERMPPLRG